MIDIGIIDSFRVTNPNRRLYTYTHSNKSSKARLDRIYISKDLRGKILSSTTEFSSESDHRFINLNMAKEVEHGPGTWIFNNMLLSEESFTSEIQDIIRTYVTNKNDFQSSMTLWEFLKQNMASVAKKFSVQKTRGEKIQMTDVRQKIEALESIGQELITDNIRQTLDELKEMEHLFTSKIINGSLLRSKVPGIEEGDTNLAYYSKRKNACR